MTAKARAHRAKNTVHVEPERFGVLVDSSSENPPDRYTMFEKISYLYWKIYKSYKNKGHTQWEAGKIAKTVCSRTFGYYNYQEWRHRFDDEHYSQIYRALKAKGYDRSL